MKRKAEGRRSGGGGLKKKGKQRRVFWLVAALGDTLATALFEAFADL